MADTPHKVPTASPTDARALDACKEIIAALLSETQKIPWEAIAKELAAADPEVFLRCWSQALIEEGPQLAGESQPVIPLQALADNKALAVKALTKGWGIPVEDAIEIVDDMRNTLGFKEGKGIG